MKVRFAKPNFFQGLTSVVLAMLLACSAFLPAIASPIGIAPNPTGAQLELKVLSGDIGSAYEEVDHVSNKDITQPLYAKLAVTSDQATVGEQEVVFAKPKYSKVVLGQDSETLQYVSSVSGNEPESEEVTLVFANSAPEFFTVFYSVVYGQNFTNSESVEYAPTLKILGRDIVTANSTVIDTNCETTLFPGVRLASETGTVLANNPDFSNEVVNLTKPSSSALAKVGPSYTFRGVMFNCLPGALPSQFDNANGQSVLSSTLEITLPAEATLMSYDRSQWDVSTVAGGRKKLTSSQAHFLDSATNTIGFGLKNATAPTFSVAYTAAPPQGTTAYTYDTKVTGQWLNGESFSFENTGLEHLYSTQQTVAAVSLKTSFAVDTFGETPDNNGVSSLNQTDPAFISIGDTNNQKISVANTGDATLVDPKITIPFEGNKWDITNFLLGDNNLPLPYTDTFSYMQLVYSDGSDRTVDFSDSSKFDFSGSSLLTRAISPSFRDWYMQDKEDDVYITQIVVGLNSLSPEAQLDFGFQMKLRAQKRTGGSLTAFQDIVQAKASITSANRNNPADVVEAASQTPFSYIGGTGNAQFSNQRVTVSQTGVADTQLAGDTIEVDSSLQFDSGLPASYRSSISNPIAFITVPSFMNIQDDSFVMKVEGGSADAPTTTTVPALNVQYLGAKYDASTKTTTYQVRYRGTLSYRGAWRLTVSYKTTAPLAAPSQGGFVQTTWLNHENLIKGDGVIDAMDFNNNAATADAIPGQRDTFVFTSSRGVHALLSANGDLDAPDSWKVDSPSILAPSNSVLGNAKKTGSVRLLITNKTQGTISGDAYVTKPTGDFTPNLSGMSFQKLSLSTLATETVTPELCYTTNANGVNSDDWIPFSNPSDVPKEATAFKVSVGTVAQQSLIDARFIYDIPEEALHGQTVRSSARLDMNTDGGTFNESISDAGLRVVKTGYTVRYYKDSVSPSNFLDDVSVPASFGDIVILGAGVQSGDLDCFLPEKGFFTGVQQASDQFIPSIFEGAHIVTNGDNVINVVYRRKNNLTAKVTYYKNNLSGVVLGTAMVSGLTYKDVLMLSEGTGSAQLNQFIPDDSYEDGIQQAQVVVDDTINEVKVVYSKKPAPIKPVVSSTNVIYIKKGKAVTEEQILALAGVEATDSEDGRYASDVVTVTGLENIKTSVSNYPGKPYIVYVGVVNSRGIAASKKPIAVFVK